MLNKLNDRVINNLIDTIVSITDRDICADFLVDLCTITEIKSMAQRLEVAKLLSDGYVYSEIAQKTGASTATISRVKRAMEYGNGGYGAVLSEKVD